MFTREEASSLLLAEKLAARFTDVNAAQLSHAAMDKLRAVLRHPDRDYLENLSPQLQMVGRRPAQTILSVQQDFYQQLLTAISTQHIVHIATGLALPIHLLRAI